MSRSIKGSKGPGYEYWGRRCELREPGRFTKTYTHGLERRQGKKEVQNARPTNQAVSGRQAEERDDS
jgi:hypothetical protein